MVIRGWFSLGDVDLVLQCPLRFSWPNDKLIWYFTSNSNLTIRSTYRVACLLSYCNMASSNLDHGDSFWKNIWKLNVPPWFNLFTCMVGLLVLPTRTSIALLNFCIRMRHPWCSWRVTCHIFLCHPLTKKICQGSGFDAESWFSNARVLLQWLLMSSIKTTLVSL